MREQKEPKARLRQAYAEAFTREPQAQELEHAMEFLNAHPETDEAVRWADLCHVLFAANEFIYVD